MAIPCAVSVLGGEGATPCTPGFATYPGRAAAAVRESGPAWAFLRPAELGPPGCGRGRLHRISEARPFLYVGMGGRSLTGERRLAARRRRAKGGGIARPAALSRPAAGARDAR